MVMPYKLGTSIARPDLLKRVQKKITYHFVCLWDSCLLDNEIKQTISCITVFEILLWTKLKLS